MVVVVQLVFASTGCRLPLEVKHQRTSPLFASSSSQMNANSSAKIFVSNVLSCVHSCRPAPLGGANAEGVRRSYLELFDYATLKPLLANEVVVDGQKLLLFTPPFLTNALTVQLLNRCHQTSMNTQNICTEEEERWQNLRQAIQALNVPLDLHHQLMVKEMETCFKRLENTEREFLLAKEGMHGALEKMKETTVFCNPDSFVLEMIDVKHLDLAVQHGEIKLRDASKSLEDAQSMAPDVIKEILTEARVSDDFEKTSAWNSYFESSVDGCSESAVTTLMKEVDRKVCVVHRIVGEVRKITKIQQRCRHYCDAVLGHVVQRQKKLCLLPEGLDAAREVVKRRIILRRAIRRLLVPLEAEYRAAELSIHQFTEKWNQLLPDGIFKSVSSPLPPLYPPDDVVAQNMDRLLVDVEEDETEKLLVSIGVGSSSAVASKGELEVRLVERERELICCKSALETMAKENSELEVALRQLRGTLPS